MRLFLRPVRHVLRADIAGKHFLPHDFRLSVNAETYAFVLCVPLWRLQNFFFKQRSVCTTVQWREINGDTSDHSAFNKAPPGRVEIAHKVPCFLLSFL